MHSPTASDLGEGYRDGNGSRSHQQSCDGQVELRMQVRSEVKPGNPNTPGRGVGAGMPTTYIHQARTEGPGMNLNGAPGPTGRGCGWASQVRLVGLIKAYGCPQNPDTELQMSSCKSCE